MIFNVNSRMHDMSTFTNWFVMHLITEHTKDNDEHSGKFIELHADRKLEVKITIGGEEIDFQCAIDRVESQLDSMIESKAKDLVNNKLGTFFGQLGDMKRDFRDAIEAKLGLKLSEED